MATYNFTVRATDNAGAFADRTFSINVNDTTATSTYDRFLAVGNGGVSRSVDGLNWTTDSSISGMNRAVYGNGVWIIFSTNNGQYRWAPASTMAWSALQSFGSPVQDPNYPSISGWNGVDIRFRKGKWTAMVNYAYSSQSVQVETTASDISAGSNWAYVRTVGISTPNTSGSACSFDYDPTSDTWVTIHANYLYRRQGTGAWSRTSLAYSQLGNYLFGTGDLRFTNGLWLMSGYYSDGIIFTSLDGNNFVARNTGAAGVGVAPVYQNGRIITLPLYTGTQTNQQIRESTNGGRSFVVRGPAFVAPQGYVQTSALSVPRQITATNGTMTVWTGPSIGGGLLVSTDDFLTSSLKTIPVQSAIYSVAARDS